MSKLLSGQVALVTGGAAGIGRATALAFAAAGVKVVVADLDSAGGEGTVEAIRQAGGEALFIRCDVTRDAEVKALFGLPAGDTVRAIVAVGYPADETPRPKSRKDVSEITTLVG